MINAKNENSWRLENEVLRADIEFDSSDGRIDMTSFYNKEADRDYLTGSGDRNLFKYGTIEEDESSHDKAENLMFTVNCDEAEKIKYFGNGWVGGTSLHSTCEASDYFEFLFKGTAIEYHAATAHSGGLADIYVDGELVDIVDLHAPIEDGEIDRLVYANYSLSDGLHIFKAIHRRNENKDGQSSMNVSHIRYGRVDSRTIYAPQEETAVIDGATVTRFITPSFEAIEVDHTDPAVTYSKPNEWQKWQVTHSYTNTPGEYAEYTFTGTDIKVYGVKAQNRGMMDVFIDDEFRKRVDMHYDKQLEPTLVFDSGSHGRMAIEEHFHKRYKYADPTRRISTNNWGYQKTGIYSVYSAWLPHFNDVVIPAAVAANLDAIHFDHFWTGVGSFYDIDSAQWISDITDDPVAFVQKVNEAGLKFGLWFSPTGGFWGEGRDFADLSVFDGKIAQFEDYILNPDQYNAKWVQFDYGIFWKKSEVTPYSHPTDSVFRKYINAREFTQRFTHKDSDLFVQMTCEVDNPSWSTPQGVALLHIADNSLAGMYERTVYRDAAKDCFSAFGLLPMNSTLSTWGAWDYWSDKVEYFYQFLLARHSSVYTDPVFWGADGIAVLKEFNNWRKNPRMESVLNELFRPVYSGSNLSGPLVWVYTDEFREKAIVAAIGSTGGTSVSEVNLRWLDDNKTYLIEDISLLDGGKAQGHLAKFDYRFVGKKTGAQLKEEGFKINFETNYSDGKAYWIQEFKPVMQQVIYADSAVCAYDETWDGDTLTVNITDGIPDAAATVIAYKEYAQNTEVKEIVLDAQGHGQVKFVGATVTEPLLLLKRTRNS